MTSFRTPWDRPPVAVAVATRSLPQPKPRGRRPDSTFCTSAPCTPAAPNWLYHDLTISGPADDVADFAQTARGPGVIPWRLDGAAIEEQIFTLAVSQPPHSRHLTIEGCRILARQFRDRAETRQARAIARVGHSKACPFDLQVLLPVPVALLQLGPLHTAALTWLSSQWGITDHPRQVTSLLKPKTEEHLPAYHAVIGYSFFTADDTPHAAIAQLGTRWRALRFVLRPHPLG